MIETILDRQLCSKEHFSAPDDHASSKYVKPVYLIPLNLVFLPVIKWSPTLLLITLWSLSEDEGNDNVEIPSKNDLFNHAIMDDILDKIGLELSYDTDRNVPLDPKEQLPLDPDEGTMPDDDQEWLETDNTRGREARDEQET
uniref:Uncharacterized protein n=1 Tax=Romanomermis culicivorax TaxID=13658 RepID=A0A915JA04_ROMCU